MSDIEIKGRILEKARDHYFNNGFSASTMDDLAHLLGMSKKTIYKYFSSKDEIISAITHEKLNDIHAHCNHIHNDATIEFLERIKCVTHYISKEMQAMKPSFYTDIQKTMPQLWKEINAFRYEKVIKDFRTTIREGIELGVFRKDINVEVLVLMYANAMESIVNPETLSTLPLTASQAYDAIVDIVFGGIFTDLAKEKYHHPTPSKQIPLEGLKK